MTEEHNSFLHGLRSTNCIGISLGAGSIFVIHAGDLVKRREPNAKFEVKHALYDNQGETMFHVE